MILLTPYSEVIVRFERKVKEYKEFFCYEDTTEEQFLEIINRRELDLLEDALNELQLVVSVSQNVDFLDKDDTLELFNFNLTSLEKDLISDFMIVKLFDEGLIRLKQYQKYFGEDIKMPNSNTERTTYLKVSEHIRYLLDRKISNYNSKDRKTGKHLLAY
jgi:hypothetical protein